MEDSIFVISLMVIVLDAILALNMLGVELAKEQLYLPFHYLRTQVQTPISSILYFLISAPR